MGSAVNIGVNRRAIGMNRSGMTLLPDLNLSRYPVFPFFSFCLSFSFFFFYISSFSRERERESNLAASVIADIICPCSTFVHFDNAAPSSRRRTRKSWFQWKRRKGNFPLVLSLPLFLSLLKRVDLSLSAVFFSISPSLSFPLSPSLCLFSVCKLRFVWFTWIFEQTTNFMAGSNYSCTKHWTGGMVI